MYRSSSTYEQLPELPAGQMKITDKRTRGELVALVEIGRRLTKRFQLSAAEEAAMRTLLNARADVPRVEGGEFTATM